MESGILSIFGVFDPRLRYFRRLLLDCSEQLRSTGRLDKLFLRLIIFGLPASIAGITDDE